MVNFRWLGSNSFYQKTYQSNLNNGGFYYYEGNTYPYGYLITPYNHIPYTITNNNYLVWTPSSGNWWAYNNQAPSSFTWNVQGPDYYTYFFPNASTLVFENSQPQAYNPAFNGSYWQNNVNNPPYGYFNNYKPPFLTILNYLRYCEQLYVSDIVYPFDDSSFRTRYLEYQWYYYYRDTTDTYSPFFYDLCTMSVRFTRRNGSYTGFWTRVYYPGYQLIEITWGKVPHTLGFNDPSYSWTSTGLYTSSMLFYPAGNIDYGYYVPVNLSPFAPMNNQCLVFAAAWNGQYSPNINYYNVYNNHSFNF